MQRLQRFLPFLTLIVFITLGYGLYRWYFYYYPYTRDAFIYANVNNVSSQVNGEISQVLVKDNQAVNKQQTLITIDSSKYQIALAKAKAQLDAALLAQQQAKTSLQVAKATLAKYQVSYQQAYDYFQRLDALYKKKAISQENLTQQQVKLAVAKANVNLAQQQFLLAKEKINNNAIEVAKAEVAQAQLDLNHTVIKAQHTGYISNVFAESGNYVAKGQSLFALIDTHRWWVIANFRETVLRRLKIGQTVNIHIDMFPNKTFHGKIASISWGVNRREASSDVVPSALAFLKTTQDWIRIAQRFPVRISLSDLPKTVKLRVGASCQVKVNV